MSEQEKGQLSIFRDLHNIEDRQHDGMLQECGWSVADYERGATGDSDGGGGGGGGGVPGGTASHGGLRTRLYERGCGTLCRTVEQAVGPVVYGVVERGVRMVEGAQEAALEALESARAALPPLSSASSPEARRERSHSLLRHRRSQGLVGGKGGLAERPLAIWDERKEGVALAQERLNAYFGTNALEVDGEFGPLTQQAPASSRRAARRGRPARRLAPAPPLLPLDPFAPPAPLDPPLPHPDARRSSSSRSSGASRSTGGSAPPRGPRCARRESTSCRASR